LTYTEATEPSNIIWENRHFTAKDREVRCCVAFFLIMLLALGAFVSIYLCSVYVLK